MTATESPFHVGEQAVQHRLGVREQIEPWARKVVRPWMPDQHRDFYSQLPFVVVSARDKRGRPWITLLAGEPGFIQSPDDSVLHIHSRVLPGDALEDAMPSGLDVGLLGIELDTRRRNRVNGRITREAGDKIVFEVDQAFGNCPQYITERTWYPVDVDPASATVARGSTLSPAQVSWIQQADTFFIGSGYDDGSDAASNGMDASHRGGPPGFVKVDGEDRLVFPDYAGNNHFNTIGNLVMDSRVALLFVDFEGGGLLQVTGRAEIDWDSAAVAEHAGAKRLVNIQVDEVVELQNVLPVRFLEPKGLVREIRVVDRRRESDDVVSFTFESRDGGDLPDFEAGQHLPIELAIVGYDTPVSRTYSLSNSPGSGQYRISVKREPEGLVSRLLHDAIDVGAVINSRSPAGDFILGHHDRPVVLISAGIGVTPMLSMLYELTHDASNRSVTFLHGARDGHHHPFAGEVSTIAGEHANVRVVNAYSQPLPEDVMGQDFDYKGRIDADVVRNTVPELDAEYFICGPSPFLTSMVDLLSELGVHDSQVHIEEF